MAAKTGNKYAQKHDREKVLEILNDAIDGLTELKTKTIVTKKGDAVEVEYYKYSSLERAMATNRVGREKPYRWLETWKDDEEVCHTIKELLDLNKTSLMANTLDGNVVASAGIFLMKAVHGMSDQAQIEEPIPEVTHDTSKLTGKQLKQFAELMAIVETSDE